MAAIYSCYFKEHTKKNTKLSSQRSCGHYALSINYRKSFRKITRQCKCQSDYRYNFHR